MMMWVALDAPHLVDLDTWRAAYRIAPSCWVIASASRARERSAARRSIVAVHLNILQVMITPPT
jgi:hypothetical protein